MTATAERTTPRASRLAGYLFALAAGAIWGTTGPLSTALYRAGEAITGIGFWRLVIGLVGFLVYGLFRPQVFKIDRKALLLVGLGGGALVALFEVAYQFGIAGTGVAGAAALLYIAPVLVAILAKPLLGEQLTALRVVLAVVVMVGAGLTVRGGSHGAGTAAIPLPSLVEGVAGGLLAMLSYAGTTLLARFAVPRYGAAQVLFLEIVGGVAVLALVLPLAGHPPLPPHTAGGWTYIVLLCLGPLLRFPGGPSAAAAAGGGHLALPAARASRADPDPGRLRETGAALLAAARGLRDRGLARHGDAHHLGRRDDPLHQQLARHACVP